MSAPLCIHCRHFRQNWQNFPFLGSMRQWGRCATIEAFEPAEDDLVAGGAREKPHQTLCVTMRGDYHACGPEAHLFEARP